MKALVNKSSAEQPYTFKYVGDDDKTVLQSESYKAKDSAIKGLKAVKTHCNNDRRYVLKESSNGKYFYNVKSSNGQVVGTSALYDSEVDRTEAIVQLKRLAPSCPVEFMGSPLEM